jgi:hypothetical protein
MTMLSAVLEAKLSKKAVCIAHISRRFDITTIRPTLHEFKLKVLL